MKVTCSRFSCSRDRYFIFFKSHLSIFLVCRALWPPKKKVTQPPPTRPMLHRQTITSFGSYIWVTTKFCASRPLHHSPPPHPQFKFVETSGLKNPFKKSIWQIKKGKNIWFLWDWLGHDVEKVHSDNIYMFRQLDNVQFSKN